MLARFSAYGFLKNQRYFEPFVLLAMLDTGLSYAQIGLLIALREIVTAALETPSGAIADVLGRRRSMVAAFAGYVAAYVVLGLADGLCTFGLGLALVGFGDAFRTGTHKAMIFDWLAAHDRQDERVQVYGYTRSWSQVGSAASIPIGAAAVFFTGSYTAVFWLAAVPAVINMVNLATYPADLDGPPQSRTVGAIWRHLWRSLRDIGRDRSLRSLLIEGAAFAGSYKVLKDYLQPVVATLAVSLVVLDGLGPQRATAVTAAAVFVALYLVSALASRLAHRWARAFATVTTAAWWLWLTALATWGGLVAVLALSWWSAAAIGFVILAVVNNLFRPLLVSRIDSHAERSAAATVLSVESQASSVTAAVLAPLVGWLVDAASQGEPQLWPAAAVAAAIGVVMLLGVVRRSPTAEPDDAPTAS